MSSSEELTQMSEESSPKISSGFDPNCEDCCDPVMPCHVHDRAVVSEGERLCLNCGYPLVGEHDPQRGYCFHGGIGEDATTYEPRPKNWVQPPPLPPLDFDSTGFDDL